MFNIYLYDRSQLIGFVNGDLISGLKMAEYSHEVNPPLVHRSAALDIDEFDRAVSNSNNERPLSGHGYGSRRDEERRARPPRGPERFGSHYRRKGEKYNDGASLRAVI
ncbi:MAG TPA: hypothetical protein VIC84_10360 [Blastocatellia bacterium]